MKLSLVSEYTYIEKGCFVGLGHLIVSFMIKVKNRETDLESQTWPMDIHYILGLKIMDLMLKRVMTKLIQRTQGTTYSVEFIVLHLGVPQHIGVLH